MGADYQRRLGERLRAIRHQQGITLQQVEERSGGEWKAVVVGSYERGDRAVSVARLSELADFYGVPVRQLLPREALPDEPDDPVAAERPIKLNLRRLTSEDVDVDLTPVTRFAQSIRLRRDDWAGAVLTVRREDLRALAVVYGTTPDDLVVQLDEQGVIAHA